MSFQNKVFTVTGAGSGMGAATCRLLAKKGAAVICAADVSSKGFKQLQESVGHVNSSTKVHCSVVDVACSAAVAEWISSVIKEFGNIHGSANIAGIPQAVGVRSSPTILEETDDAWSKIMGVNLNGVFYCTRSQVRAMKNLPREPRSIVNVASVAGKQHLPDIYAYVVSKAACIHFTSSVAKDVQPHGIRVNSVLPAATRTPMLGQFVTHTKTESETREAWRQLGFEDLLTPEEVARSIVWLLSEESAPVFGAELNVGTGFP